MNENLPNLINNNINTIKGQDKDELLYDRQKNRVSNTTIISINEHELLNQMLLTDPNDAIQREKIIKQINTYYSKKSILNYPEIKQVINNLIQMIIGESPSYIKYGMKCFIAIFCQNTYTFDYNFALTIIVEIKTHLRSEDHDIIQYTLHIAARISGVSKQLATLVSNYIDINSLAQIIEYKGFICDIKEKALCILGHFCYSLDMITDELIDLICQLSLIIFQTPELIKLHQSIIYCCALMAKRVTNFSDFFQKYSIFPFLNQILIQSHSAHTRFYILRIAHYLYRNPANFDKIDINTVYGLMKHSVAGIQTVAIQCITEVIRSDKGMIDFLIDKGIFQLISLILEKGSHKSRVACIELLFLLYQARPNEMAQIFITENYVETLLCMTQVIFETSKSLELVLTILIEVNRSMVRIGKGKEFECLFKNNRACDQLFDLTDRNNDAAHLAQILLSEIEL